MNEALERARAGDTAAFIDLLRPHHDQLRVLAASDEALLSAYLQAYRALPRYQGEPPLAVWLSGFVVERGAGAAAAEAFWRRLAAALRAEAPAMAAPRLPERRFPVLPRLQRRRRGGRSRGGR